MSLHDALSIVERIDALAAHFEHGLENVEVLRGETAAVIMGHGFSPTGAGSRHRLRLLFGREMSPESGAPLGRAGPRGQPPASRQPPCSRKRQRRSRHRRAEVPAAPLCATPLATVRLPPPPAARPRSPP